MGGQDVSPHSLLIRKGPCPTCGSSDANAVYTDHEYCYSCQTWRPAGGMGDKGMEIKKPKGLIPAGDFKPLIKRGIRKDTCELYGMTISEMMGEKVMVAPYRNLQGQVVAQHIRTPDKEFFWRGDSKKIQLWGRHLWRDKGRKVVITEGEIDCLTVSQCQGNKWPVVSLPNGVSRSRKDIANNLEWLMGFDEVILCFDMDDPGREAVEQCVTLFKPGQAKVVHLPLKDANEMLMAGREKELIDALWGAKEYRPDGLVSIDDIIEEASKPVEIGKPWFIPELTDLTYGRRLGELYAFGAGTGVNNCALTL